MFRIYLGELLQTASAVRTDMGTWKRSVGLSHFSQAFISEHHEPANDEGISRSQSVGKLQAKDEVIEELRNLYLGSQKLIDVINVQDQACKKQQPDRQLA